MLRVCLMLMLVSGCFAEWPVPKLERANASIRKVEGFEGPAAAKATVVLTPGDFVMLGGGLRVVVGGVSRGLEKRGAVLEASTEGVPVSESIVLLKPEVYVHGVARPVRVERMFVVARDKQPALRIEGTVFLQDRVISCIRELSLGRVPGTLSFSTRLETLDPAGEADVRLGARIAWGGPRPFMPGVGEIADQSFHRGELLGVEGIGGSTSFAYLDTPLSARAEYEDRAHGEALLYTSVVSPAVVNLVRAKPVYVRSVLAVAVGGLNLTARKVGFARGKPFREVWVSVPYHPEGTEVTLSDRAAHPWMAGSPDAEGKVVLPVVPVEGRLPGKMYLLASAYGHAPSDRVEIDLQGKVEPVTLTIPLGGTVRLRARDAVTREPIAVRIRLIGANGTPALELGPDYRASGARDTVVALHGDADVPVPAGRYRVLVTHGPEWSLLDTQVDVTETYSPRIDALLRHEVDPGAWIAADLHVHSEPSPDSEVSLDDRLASLEAEGIGLVVPTDHDLVTDLAPIVRELGLTHMLTLPGVEITTSEPVLGHFNAYPMPRDVTRPGNGAPDPVNVQPESLFAVLRALDPELMIQVNHPRIEGGIGYFDVMSFDAETGAADLRFSAAFDAMEVFNGFDLARPAKVEAVFRDWLAILARGQRVVATGSSDSHQVRYQLVGYPRTMIQVAETETGDPRAVMRALKAGRAFVSTGPFLEAKIGDAGPGDEATAREGRAKIEVRVRAPQWMTIDRLEIFVGRECVIDQPIEKVVNNPRARVLTPRLQQSFDLALESDAFVVVRVSGATPMDDFLGRNDVPPIAFTNPIFVDVDGDGQTVWTP